MKVQSTRPVTSVAQNRRNQELLAQGSTVTLSADANADDESRAVVDNYNELEPEQQMIARDIFEKATYDIEGTDSEEFVTAAMSGLGGAGIAALAGRSDVFSLVGGFAVGFAAGYTGHKVGTAVWSKVNNVDMKLVVESTAGGLPSVTGSVSAST